MSEEQHRRRGSLPPGPGPGEGSGHGGGGTPHPRGVQSTVTRDGEILLEGWLKKRGTRIQSLWSERYFILKGDQLVYYLKQGDTEPRGAYVLDRTCTVSELKTYTSAYDKKKLYAFRVLWPEAVEQSDLPTAGLDGSPLDHAAVGGSNPSSSLTSPPGQAGDAYKSLARGEALGGGSGTKASNAATTVTSGNTDVVTQRRVLIQQADALAPPPPPTESAVAPGPPAQKVVRSAQSLGLPVGQGGGGKKKGSGSGSVTGGATVVALVAGGVLVGAMTAGLGLVAPMVIVGVTAAAGGGATAYGVSQSVRTRQMTLVLASEDKETAEDWKGAIEAQIRWSLNVSQSRWISLVGLDRRFMPARKRQLSGRPTSATNLEDVDRWTRRSRWRPFTVYNGLRIYELDHPAEANANKARPPCRRIQVTVRATPLETFISLVRIPCSTPHGILDSMRIVERVDEQSDIIHMSLKPLYLFPTWTAPRDFCLARYTRIDEDGTHIICFDSTTHRSCPPLPGHVRASMHAVFTISPKKPPSSRAGAEYDDSPECLLTYIAQVDPRGWLWHSGGYRDAFVHELLLQVLDIRDLLETERFMAVHVDTNEGVTGGSSGGRGVGGAGGEMGHHSGPSSSSMETYKPTLPNDMWAEVDASSFVVRGPGYITDKVKVPSDKSAFRLLAVDLFDLAQPIDNIAAHPNNRVQAALKKGDCPPFVWVVQLQFPGVERHFGYVCYFAPEDMSVFEEDTPLSRVIKPFFFGDSDEYRDQRFKLIPKIVEGNWVVRKSVGSTPAILGTKLKQHYYKGPHYMELDVNIASSSVAAGVVRLAAGYAKTLVVDIGLVIQSETESELPERVVGCWRIKFMDLDQAKPIE